MSDAPERIWIEDEFGEGDDDQWTYGTWDVRNYMGYDVEYVRADIVQNLTAERDRLRRALHYYADFHSVPSDGPWGVNSKDFGTAARAALKGESHE